MGNPDLLRMAIDSSESADKASFPDPAAALLGTDDEAAGTPDTREQVARSLKAEVAERPTDREVNAATPLTDATPQTRDTSTTAAGFRGHLAAWLVGCGGVIVLVILVALMAR